MTLKKKTAGRGPAVIAAECSTSYESNYNTYRILDIDLSVFANSHSGVHQPKGGER